MMDTGPLVELSPKKLPRPAEYLATEEIPMPRGDDGNVVVRDSA
jgi:hypothetical protein